MKEQLLQILNKLIVKNNIRINQKELKLQLFSHPSYPSLHALTSVLQHFKINSAALRLPVNKETLQQLPKSWIAQIADQDENKLVLVERRNQGYSIFDATKKNKLLNELDFLKIWKGILLAVEKDESTKEEKSISFAGIRQWFLSFIGLAVVIFFVSTLNSFFTISHFILSIAGFALSVLIVSHEIGLSLGQTDRFCNLSQKTSCDAVLQSKGANLFGIITLSDISLIIFSSYLLNWLLTALSLSSNYALFAGLSLMAIPFLIYSLYYQAIIIKKWCPFCLGIGAILMLQAISMFGLSNFSITIPWQAILFFSGSLVLISSLWFKLKPLLKNRQDYLQLKLDHNKFKFHFPIFETLLNEEKSLRKSEEINQEIVLGNRNAPLEIILISSPLCFYCKAAHQTIEKIFQHYADKAKIIIRFSINIKNPESLDYQIAHYLIDRYQQQGPEKCIRLMNQVFAENTNPEEWLSKQSLDSQNNYHHTLKDQHEWSLANEIFFTPTLYINGKRYPEKYRREDLFYFIDDLSEKYTKTLIHQV